MDSSILINSQLLSRNNISSVQNHPINPNLKKFLKPILILFIIFVFLLIIYSSKSSNSITPLINKEILIHNQNFSDMNDNIDNYSFTRNIRIKKKSNNLQSYSSPTFFHITREKFLYEKQKESIILNLISHKFSGIWESINNTINKNENSENKNSSFLIGKAYKGNANFEFEKALELRTKQDAIALTIKIQEGAYIDHWIKFTSYAMYQSIIRNEDKINKIFTLYGKFLTDFEKGEIFHTTYKEKSKCFTFINISFPINYEDINATLITGESVFIGQISTINPEKFSMFVNSTCGFQFKIEGKKYNEEAEKLQRLSKLKIYFRLNIFSSILYTIGVITLILGIKKTEMAISAINIECILMISIWNFYCFCSNISLAFKGYIEFFANFLIIGLLSLSKFLLFDTCIFYIYWSIKERNISNTCQLFKLKARFYIILILLLFCVFYFVNSFLINYVYISFICMILWIPQIIHNIVSNNRYGLPFIYILACSIDRIIYPYYFRAYKDNFFMLKVNNNIFKIIIFFVCFTIIILLLQTFRGPRFMLSEKYQEFPYGFYKNKEELEDNYKHLKNENINNEECIICLSPIFDIEKNNNNIMIPMEEISDKGNINDNNTLNEQYEKGENVNIKNCDDINENETDQFTNIDKSKVDSNLTSEEELDYTSDDNNLLIKKENEIKMRINEINKNNSINNSKKDVKYFKDIFDLKNIIINAVFNIVFALKIILKKNLLFFYKSSANIHNKLYMLTPCNHIFHSECLEKWLEQKKECPNCRTSFENLI